MARRTYTLATQRQFDEIERASRRAGFTDPQLAVDAANVSSRNWRYDLSGPDASAVLDALRGGLKPKVLPDVVPVVGGMSAADAVSVLGETVAIEVRDRTGEIVARTLQVDAIKQSAVDGSPALSGTWIEQKRAYSARLSAITAWAKA